MTESTGAGAKTITPTVRRGIVLELRMAGGSDRAIQEQLRQQGVNVSHVTVNKDWHTALDELNEGQRGTLIRRRLMMQSQLERLLLPHWTSAIGSEAQQGQPAKPADLASAELCRRLIKDMRDLWGIDRSLGTEENPHTIGLSISAEDLAGYGDEELGIIETFLTKILDRAGGLRALPGDQPPS